jgi:hypothetical protein
VAVGTEHVQNIDMGKNMKGILFSMIMVFVFIFLVMFIALQQSLMSSYSSQKSTENRIDVMLGFYNSIISDSQKSLDIVGKRAISSATNQVVSNGQPLSSANDTLAELMLNGSIYGQPQGLMQGSTINDWVNTIEYLGSIEGFSTDVSIQNLEIQPSDSFHLKVSYLISVKLSDDSTKTNITKSSNQYLIMSIENFEDPLYPLSSYGRVVNILRESPHWPNYYSTNTTNLQDDLDNSFYHPSLNGASFLDRLEGKYFVQAKYAASVNIGLESFVDKDKLASAGLPVNGDATNIDYLYFSSAASGYHVSGMPTDFRLDNQTTIDSKTHLQIYNVTVIG